MSPLAACVLIRLLGGPVAFSRWSLQWYSIAAVLLVPVIVLRIADSRVRARG